MRLPPLHPALVAVLSGLALLPHSALAQAAGSKPATATASAEAVAACERATRQSLASPATQAADVRFAGTPTVQPNLLNDSQIVLQGAGSWRAASGMRSFIYRCNVGPRTSEAVGVVIRDSTPIPPQATAREGIEPDLSYLSPAACESSAATALKQRWPRVSQITFDTTTRSLLQESTSKAELHGRGLALPEPGAPSTHFGFDCEIDPRDGRVIATRISG